MGVMLEALFPARKPVVGMIHVGALPGTPAARADPDQLIEAAVREAQTYAGCGLDGLLIENMHDTPYLRGAVGPEVVASLAVVGRAVKAEAGIPVGVQVLAAANTEALAVAHAAGLDFIRAEGYAFAHVADEGLVESSAGELLRYRKRIGAERVQVWADVKKKHSAHALTADVSLGETCAAVEFMRGDAVIITGTATGEPPRVGDLREAKTHCTLPVVLGSGLTAENLSEFYEAADAFIVGSHFKAGGRWFNPIERARVESFMSGVFALRG
jgi:uncharacterized protein